jgi:hypothetical protein
MIAILLILCVGPTVADPKLSEFAKIAGLRTMILAILIFDLFTLFLLKHPFVDHLNEAQECLRLYGRKGIASLPYCMHLHFLVIEEEVRFIMLNLSDELKKAEGVHGIDSPKTLEIRMAFKRCHAAFVPFDLCEEDQETWLGTTKKKPAVTLPPEKIPVAGFVSGHHS